MEGESSSSPEPGGLQENRVMDPKRICLVFRCDINV